LAEAHAAALTPEALKAVIRDKALALGFDAVGFAPAASTQAAKDGLAAFLDAGMQGDMGWLEAHADRRADPQTLWPEARTVVVVAMSYRPRANPLTQQKPKDRGAISVYAQTARDYHDVLKSRLKQLARWTSEQHNAGVKVFVDTAPVMEKHLASRAGVGWQGKHSNVVSRDLGNWFFLGEMFLDQELEPDAPETDHCGQCSRCLDICPTNAFTGPYKLDARRCVSYLTIEHKGHIPLDLREGIGVRIYGCDDCLAVCPWNKFAVETREPGLWPRPELAAPRLAELASLNDAAFRQVFAGSPIKRTGRDRFVRNVLIAIGNSGGPDLAASAERLAADESPLVRAAAIWALGRLNAEHAARLAAERRSLEPDPEVAKEWALVQLAFPIPGPA
jgi:epoxyqueuosine reductase